MAWPAAPSRSVGRFPPEPSALDDANGATCASAAPAPAPWHLTALQQGHQPRAPPELPHGCDQVVLEKKPRTRSRRASFGALERSAPAVDATDVRDLPTPTHGGVVVCT